MGATTARAFRTSLFEKNFGVSVGGGYLMNWNDDISRFDPLPVFDTGDYSIRDSSFSRLKPVRMGVFLSSGLFNAEVYGIFLSTRKAWVVTGDLEGLGTSRYRSYGMGVKLGRELFGNDRVRLALIGMSEVYRHRLTFHLSDLSSYEQNLQLHTTTLIYGAGIEPELRLSDTSTISMLGAYMRSTAGEWNVSRTSNFLGSDRAAGPLSAYSESDVSQKSGGLLLQVVLKVAFY